MTELGSALAAPPAGLTAPCADPLELPDAPLSAGAVERAMAADRAGLLSCGGKHRALIDFYTARDAGLAGAPAK